MHTHRTLTRAVPGRILLTALALLCLAALLAPPADARGTYTQLLCANPRTGQGLLAADGRLPSGLDVAGNRDAITPDDRRAACGPGPVTGHRGVPIHIGVPFSTSTPSDWTGALTYRPAPGTSLAGAELWWSADLAGTTHMGVSVHGGAPLGVYALPRAGLCEWADCAAVGSPDEPFGEANHLVWPGVPGDGFHLTAGCLIPDPSWTCTGSQTDLLRLYGARLTLADDAAPQLVGPATGALASADRLAGEVRVSLGASDAGGGVYRLILLVDGAPAVTLPADQHDDQGRCADADPGAGDAYEFTDRAPCPTSVGGTWTVDTAALPEGAHGLRLVVEDAAGNRTVALDRSVTIDNVPPPANVEPPSISGRPAAGSGLAADPGRWTGTDPAFTYAWQRCDAAGACSDIADAHGRTYEVAGPDAGHRLRVRVTATDREGATAAVSAPTDPVPAVVDGPAPDPQPAWLSGVHVRASIGGHRSATVRWHRPLVVRGRLTDADGRPLAGVALTVRERAGGSAARIAGSVRTDQDGRFRHRTRATASGTLQVLYAPGTAMERSAGVQVRVPAPVGMRVSRHALRNGRTLRWSGRLHGLGAGGRVVEIQVRIGRRWQIACATRTTASGSYRCAHRFSRTFVRTRYVFRTKARAQAGYPYATGHSPARSVVVRPT